jgi:hypothetical protein
MRGMQFNVEFREFRCHLLSGPIKATENLDRVGRSQDLPDAY